MTVIYKFVALCTSLLAVCLVGTLCYLKVHSSTQVLGIFGRAIADKVEPPRFEFPQEYHATGRLLLPHSKIEEPFEIWFTRKQNRSRIDYYYGKFVGLL